MSNTKEVDRRGRCQIKGWVHGREGVVLGEGCVCDVPYAVVSHGYNAVV